MICFNYDSERVILNLKHKRCFVQNTVESLKEESDWSIHSIHEKYR